LFGIPALMLAQVFPAAFQQAGSFAAPGSLPQLGEVWQSQWVSGKPYSATVVTHTVQTFSNGTKVDHTETGLVYRDAQGRTRRETQGGSAQSGAVAVSIVDPVAGTECQYAIREVPAGGRGTVPARGPFYTIQPMSPYILANETKPGGLSPYQMALERGQGKKSGGMKSGGRGNAAAPSGSVEDLGTQTVNGMLAQGVRVTNTIPAGSFGNDRDIRVVTDRWVSPELQVIVKSVYSDPRFGTTTYELTNISLNPPDHALFQPPAGYELRESKRGGDGGQGFVGFPVQANFPPAPTKK